MAVGTNRWKLGLFVILGTGLALAVLVVFGARRWNERTVSYVSFFDESVQGLDVGSPVKFRGVTIGLVSAIEVAPDHRHVEVDLELAVDQLERLNLGSLRNPNSGFAATSKLRVQLAQTGITGVKFILLDFFDGTGGPPLTLPFPTPRNTIPTTPSTMKNLEDSLVRAANQFPDIASALLGTVTKLNGLLDSVEKERLPARASGTLDRIDATMAELKTQIEGLNSAELSRHAARDLALLEQTLHGVDRVLVRLESDKGLVQSAERVADSMGEVARGARTVGPEVELTLREVRGAARSIKRFAETLERDPDMLLKGRAAAAAP
jgi:phospholipid/cholesterol/gamma-HCH transport system substrate-binding protein